VAQAPTPLPVRRAGPPSGVAGSAPWARAVGRRAPARRPGRPSPTQVALGILSLLVLVAGLTTVRDLLRQAPRLGLLATGDGRVLFLDPTGTAALAGVHVSDTIRAIDGVAAPRGGFSDLAHAPRGIVYLTEGTAGSFTTLGVPLVDATGAGVTGPSGAEVGGDIVALIAALTLWLTGLAFGLPRRALPARLYSLAALAFALASIALVARDGPAYWPWPVLTPSLLVGLAALTLAGVSLARGPARGKRRGDAFRALTVVVGVAAGLPALTAVLGAVVGLLRPDIAVAWIVATMGVLAMATIVGPATAHTRTRDEPRRWRLRVALLATTLGLLPLALWPGLTVIAVLTGRFAPLVPAAATLTPTWSLLGLAPLAGLYAALLVADDTRLRRLDRAARTLLPYVAAIVVCGIALTALWPHVDAAARAPLIAAALLLLPLAQRLAAALVTRAARRREPDYPTALRLVEELADAASSPGELATGVVTRLPALLGVRAVSILLEGLDCPANEYRVFGPAARRDATVPIDAALVAARPEATRPFAPTASGLPPAALAVVRRLDATLWAPLWWDGGQHGALTLGPRVSGEPFDAPDIDEIAALSGVLALALNALDLVGHLRDRTATLAQFTHRLSHAHEQERAHLSRELHDVVAQELIALTRQLRRYGEDRAPPPAIWADMLAAAQDALTATRRICNGLRPAILDLGLVPALRDLVAEVDERDATTRVSLTVDGAEQRLPAELEFALFRVAQEGLNNALAHAHARQIRVEVAFRDGACLRVRDDGRGFIAPARFEDLPGDHLGLIGMRERLAEFDGALTIVSQPGRGTVLEASVPSSSHPPLPHAGGNGERHPSPSAARGEDIR